MYGDAKGELELILRSCIYISEWAEKVAVDPGRRGAVASMVFHMSAATNLMKELIPKIEKINGFLAQDLPTA